MAAKLIESVRFYQLGKIQSILEKTDRDVIDQVDEGGSNALHVACALGEEDLVELLLR